MLMMLVTLFCRPLFARARLISNGRASHHGLIASLKIRSRHSRSIELQNGENPASSVVFRLVRLSGSVTHHRSVTSWNLKREKTLPTKKQAQKTGPRVSNSLHPNILTLPLILFIFVASKSSFSFEPSRLLRTLTISQGREIKEKMQKLLISWELNNKKWQQANYKPFFLIDYNEWMIKEKSDLVLK